MSKENFKITIFIFVLLSPIVLLKIYELNKNTTNDVNFENSEMNSKNIYEKKKTIKYNPGPSQEELKDLPAVIIKDITVKTEVAYTDEARHLGLMYRKQMHENHGMFFVYKNDQRLSFWMKNTVMPLSIAFIRKNGEIVNILKMKPNDIKSKYVSTDRVRYALEMPQGWFAHNGIKEGDIVNFQEIKNWLKNKVIEE